MMRMIGLAALCACFLTVQAQPDSAAEQQNKYWYELDITQNKVPGLATRRAYQELLQGMTPTPVVVAVLDSGVDTTHPDLRASLWTNPREVPGNGKDDDGNGYVDDVHGWNFIGGADGRDVNQDTYELTREYVRLKAKYNSITTPTAAQKQEFSYYQRIKAAYTTKAEKANSEWAQLKMVSTLIGNSFTILQQALGTDSLTPAAAEAFKPDNAAQESAQRVVLSAYAQGLSPAKLKEAEGEYKSIVDGYNADFDPRSIVADNYSNLAQRIYGNADCTGPNAVHGTHVAGIIAANRNNNLGINGVAGVNARILAVRVVPDGDERDKDVANGIRYAVDQGARVINMSFGKPYSPQKEAVDAAVAYAQKKGVLLVHAAGNEGQNIDVNPHYPSPNYLNKQRAANWLEVGASSASVGPELIASFSNYGAKMVDVFAPGVNIYSTVPGGKYDFKDGTSMAAPMVTGLAATLFSYFPRLTAAEVKAIIIASAVPYKNISVPLPQNKEDETPADEANAAKTAPFGTLSRTGGIANLYEAVKLAKSGAKK